MTDFTGYKMATEAERSLNIFHGHPCTVSGSVHTYANNVNGQRVAEAYVRHPDGSCGYEHTVDGVTWIPRERSVFDRSLRPFEV